MKNTYTIAIALLSSSLLHASEKTSMPTSLSPRSHVRQLYLPQAQALYQKIIDDQLRVPNRILRTGQPNIDKLKSENVQDVLLTTCSAQIFKIWYALFEQHHAKELNTLNITEQFDSELKHLHSLCTQGKIAYKKPRTMTEIHLSYNRKLRELTKE